MSSPENPAYSAAVPPAAAVIRPRVSTLAIVAFGLGALETILLLIVRLAASGVIVSGVPNADVVATTFGVLGLLSIVFTAAVIVLGHIGLIQTKGGARRGRALAGAALGLGYFHLALYGNRLILAALAVSSIGDWSQFLPNIFYWA